MKSICTIRTRLTFVCAASILTLAACSSAKVVDEAAMAKPTGSAFNQGLHKDYVTLAKSELDQGDRSDAEHYAMKAKEAAAGKPVPPDQVSARSLNAPEANTLTEARMRLVSALDGPVAAKKPDQAAKAQSMFDCWLAA